MSTQIFCPNCNHPNPAKSSECARCGINLAIAAALADNPVSKSMLETNAIPVAPELLTPRLGDYLLEKGAITSKDLEMALAFQKKETAAGTPVLLGQALIELGVIDQAILDHAITEQIYYLQEALRKSNQTLEQRVNERTAELREALKKLTNLNTLKTNFVSNISHELRTPLAHMVGYIDLLREGELGPLSPDQVKAVNVLLKAYNRLYGLIDNLIQFSLVSQGQLAVEAHPVEVIKLIEAAVSHAQATASEKNIQLKYLLPPETLRIRADEERITWVLEQLADNAIKFNKSNGEVGITFREDGAKVVFSIKDTGIGIEKEQIDEIFEPFHQLDSSSTRRYGGTGIGLSLAQQILVAHGSELKVKSIPGKGSLFEFALPMEL
jgi:signal transduction histidine kinase